MALLACALTAVFAFGQEPALHEAAQQEPVSHEAEPQEFGHGEAASVEFSLEDSDELDTAWQDDPEEAVLADTLEGAQPQSAPVRGPLKAAVYVTGLPDLVAKPFNSAIGSALLKTKIYAEIERIDISGPPSPQALIAAGSSAGVSYIFGINASGQLSVAILDVKEASELAKTTIDGKITVFNSALMAKKIVDFILTSGPKPEPEAQADAPPRQHGQPEGEQKRMKLGVLYFESLTGHDKLASEMTDVVTAGLDSLGLYDVYLPDDIDRALANAKIRKPNNCRDPKCVQSIAKALGLERMVYGTVDMNGNRCGVNIVLIDVSYGRPIENVSIEGAEGVPAQYVVQYALDRIHGYESQADVRKYFGPEVDNVREFMWSSIAVLGAGVFYSVINYGLGGASGAVDVELVGGAYENKTYSGVPALSNQIPMFARPAALANAYTAISDDAYGVLYNPAGMPFALNREAALAYQYRFGMDLLAATYVNKATRDLGFGQALLLSTDRDNLMTELYFITAAGYKFNQMPIMGPLSVGASIKLMGNTVNDVSPDSPRGQSFGGGLDLGLMWELSQTIRYGITMRDVLSVNRWKNRTTGYQYNEWMPVTMHMGGSYRAGYTTLLVAEGEIPLYADQPWVMAGGMEFEFFRIFALRLGLQKEIMDEHAGGWKITGGGGLKFDIEPMWGKYLNLDFAYEYNTLELFPVVNVSVRVGF
jgi:hypothetical protein